MPADGFASKVDFGGNEFVFIRVISWIVSFVRKTKDDPRSHTNQHEAKHSCLELDPTFEAKLRLIINASRGCPARQPSR
jgi:hypothetical protein